MKLQKEDQLFLKASFEAQISALLRSASSAHISALRALKGAWMCLNMLAWGLAHENNNRGYLCPKWAEMSSFCPNLGNVHFDEKSMKSSFYAQNGLNMSKYRPKQPKKRLFLDFSAISMPGNRKNGIFDIFIEIALSRLKIEKYRL